MRILIVEDERFLAEALCQILKKNHYMVDVSYDGEDGLDNALSGIYDLILLDIMLPKRDGISLLREIRLQGIGTPVLLLTAKGEISDKVTGLDSGADDYLAKPFSTEELLARIRALSRRRGEVYPDNLLRFQSVMLDSKNLLISSGTKSIKLTLKESELLELLMVRFPVPVSKETMIEKVWGYDSDAEDNHVEVYISFLRKKLAHLECGVSIQTVRGVGYVLGEVDACSKN